MLLTPNVHVGAFAKTTYGSGKLGQPTVQALRKPFGRADNSTWSNLHTYSYHSYGGCITKVPVYDRSSMLAAAMHAPHGPCSALSVQPTCAGCGASTSLYTPPSVCCWCAGQSGRGILANFVELQANSSADRAALQTTFPFSITEHNARTSGDFSSSTVTMETPSQAAKLGAHQQ